MQAQKGFFIARSFGKYAVAQAKKDKRIELLIASTELDILPPVVASLHIVQDTLSPPNLLFSVTNSDSQEAGTHTFTNDSAVKYKGQEMLLSEFAERIQNTVKNEVMKHEPTGTFSESIYPYHRDETFTLQPGELFVDGHECVGLDAHVSWDSQIIRPKIVSKFDIKSRGRVITLESDKLTSGLDIKTSFIAIE